MLIMEHQQVKYDHSNSTITNNHKSRNNSAGINFSTLCDKIYIIKNIQNVHLHAKSYEHKHELYQQKM